MLNVNEGIFYVYIILHKRYRLPRKVNSLEKLLHFSVCGSRQIGWLGFMAYQPLWLVGWLIGWSGFMANKPLWLVCF